MPVQLTLSTAVVLLDTVGVLSGAVSLRASRVADGDIVGVTEALELRCSEAVPTLPLVESDIVPREGERISETVIVELADVVADALRDRVASCDAERESVLVLVSLASSVRVPIVDDSVVLRVAPALSVADVVGTDPERNGDTEMLQVSLRDDSSVPLRDDSLAVAVTLRVEVADDPSSDRDSLADIGAVGFVGDAEAVVDPESLAVAPSNESVSDPEPLTSRVAVSEGDSDGPDNVDVPLALSTDAVTLLDTDADTLAELVALVLPDVVRSFDAVPPEAVPLDVTLPELAADADADSERADEAVALGVADRPIDGEAEPVAPSDGDSPVNEADAVRVHVLPDTVASVLPLTFLEELRDPSRDVVPVALGLSEADNVHDPASADVDALRVADGAAVPLREEDPIESVTETLLVCDGDELTVLDSVSDRAGDGVADADPVTLPVPLGTSVHVGAEIDALLVPVPVPVGLPESVSLAADVSVVEALREGSSVAVRLADAVAVRDALKDSSRVADGADNVAEALPDTLTDASVDIDGELLDEEEGLPDAVRVLVCV